MWETEGLRLVSSGVSETLCLFLYSEPDLAGSNFGYKI